MAAEDPRGGWAYVSLVSALPGVTLSERAALAVQLLLFEGGAVALSATTGRWDALPLATAAIVVATAGSAAMLSLSRRIRALAPPERYRRMLFDSSVDVVMGLVAFVALGTYLLLGARSPDGGLLVRLLGEPLPALPVAFGLLVAWDVCYRIGTAWWVSITGLWRTVAFRAGFDPATRRGYLAIEARVLGFAALQLALVPLLWAERPLALAVLGHVLAVLAVSGLTILLLRRGGAT